MKEGEGKLTVTGLGCGEEVLQDALTSSTIDKVHLLGLQQSA